jgi:hypothetical protein
MDIQDIEVMGYGMKALVSPTYLYPADNIFPFHPKLQKFIKYG